MQLKISFNLFPRSYTIGHRGNTWRNTLTDLEAGIEGIRNSPKEQGVLDIIVRRPGDDAREVLKEGELDTAVGLVGDNWQSRSSSRSADGRARPDIQINIMNSRVIALVAQNKDRGQLAGGPVKKL